jgi:DNA-binding transcriptional LysR family regulator
MVKGRSAAHPILMSSSELSWELYETFLALMRTGSLSGASRALGVAQPMMRRRVEALQKFARRGALHAGDQQLVPTDAARATLPMPRPCRRQGTVKK